MALTITGILSLFLLMACGGEGGAATEPARNAESRESGEPGSEHGGQGSESRESGGEHGGEGSESGKHGEGGEGTEESGTQYGLDDTYDNVRGGARLIISYDRGNNAFTGTVENTTVGTLRRVRVEVHLSNGIELGPTTPVDLASGDTAEATLEASSQPFKTWSAHPEVG